MIYRFLFCLLVYALSCSTISAAKQNRIYGVLVPEEFGAKGDGIHDDTEAIQKAIDSLVTIGGGTVQLGSGTYLAKTVKLGPKVSLVGNGNGATILKQIRGEKQNFIAVQDIAAALKIVDMTIMGEGCNCGVYFEESGGYGENHHYLYTNTSNWNASQAYKWITIENVCVYHFDVGLKIERWGFNINICNSTFSHNGDGVVMYCTDSSLYNCYVTNNQRMGLVVGGGNNKVNNVKSIFNGISDPKRSGAIAIWGSRCQINNCETQDNYGRGFIIVGQYNAISNCISNTDGYSGEPKRYEPSIKACGFNIKGLYNIFSNCAVTSYIDKFGAIYYSPVIVDEAAIEYYSDIFNDIKVLIPPNKVLFNEPFKNVQVLSSKNRIEMPNIEAEEGGCYFVTKQNTNNVIKDLDFNLNSLSILVDFKSYGNGGRLLDIDGDKDLRLIVEKKRISILWQGKKESELAIDEDAIMGIDDIRLVVSFIQYQDRRSICLSMYEKTAERGWIKKEVRLDTKIPAEWVRKALVKIGDSRVYVKRVAITQVPILESQLLPSSNTNRMYETAIVYLDADSCL